MQNAKKIKKNFKCFFEKNQIIFYSFILPDF